MAVRIKLKLRSKGTSKEVEVNALVNSGYETDKPEILIPTKVAELLGLWPSVPKSYIAKEYFTAGGPVRNYVLINEAEVSIIVEYNTEIITSDLVISPIEEEVLISDKLTGKLGIEVYDFAEGIWKLKTDTPDVRRKSVEKQVWR